MTIEEVEKPFYEEDEKSDESEEEKQEDKAPPKPSMDPDHRLLLKNARPLLQSRNAAVSNC